MSSTARNGTTNFETEAEMYQYPLTSYCSTAPISSALKDLPPGAMMTVVIVCGLLIIANLLMVVILLINRSQKQFKWKTPRVWSVCVCSSLGLLLRLAASLSPPTVRMCLTKMVVSSVSYIVYLVFPTGALYRLYYIYNPQFTLDVVIFSERRAVAMSTAGAMVSW
jgi:hypothetical protein